MELQTVPEDGPIDLIDPVGSKFVVSHVRTCIFRCDKFKVLYVSCYKVCLSFRDVYQSMKGNYRPIFKLLNKDC